MYQVKFNAPDEFIEELRKSDTIIHGGIVRTCTRTTQSAGMPLIHVSYCASAVVTDRFTQAPAYVIALEYHCGQTFHNPIDTKVKERMDQAGEQLEAVLKELMLEHRHGVIEVGK